MYARDYAAKGEAPRLFVTEHSVAEYAELASVALSPENQHLNNQMDPGYRTKHGTPAKWYGGLKSWEAVHAIVAKGWASGASRLKELARELEGEIPAAQSRRRRPRWADDGHTLDEDRALAGQWDSAYRTAFRELGAGSTIVELHAPVGGNCNLTAEELFWSGAAMLVCTDLLEEAGYSVRLVGMHIGWHYDASAFTVNRVVLKDAGEPLRTDALASVVCHAGVFRTLGFRAIAQAPWNVGEGFGSSRPPERVAPCLEAHGEMPEQCVTLTDSYDREAAIKNIRKVVAMLQGGADKAA